MSEVVQRLIGGIDIGNGYTKGVIKGSLIPQGGKKVVIDEIDLPSGVRSTTRPVPKTPRKAGEAVEITAGDFYNVLDASFLSPLVDNEHRRIFGRAGLQSEGSRYIEFNIAGENVKANKELTKVLTLGVFAAKAVRDWVGAHGSLPDHEIVAEVYAGLALPVNEYVSEVNTYGKQFTENTHLVTVKNFETPVRVKLVFKDVALLPEGASAQFAINDKGMPLFELLIQELRAKGITLDGVEPIHLYQAKNTLGCDIGEGTTNVISFAVNGATGKGEFNDNASDTLGVGYGSVLLNAMKAMEGRTDFHYPSRKSLSEFLQSTPSPMLKQQWDTTWEYVRNEMHDFAEQVADKVEEVLGNAGPTEVIYVYGGGSGPVRDVLHDVLIERIKSIPVFYLGVEYSRFLNREGLYLAAKHIAEA